MATNNLDLFPARISDRVVRAAETPKDSRAAGGFNPTADTVVIPIADTAYARTVRLHESGHALYSRSEAKPDLVSQAVEDAKIHTMLETSGSVRRDELYSAIVDTRSTLEAIKEGNTQRALQGVMLLRAASILSKPDSSNHGIDLLTTAAEAYHPQGMKIVSSILSEVKAGNYEAAKRLSSVWFINEEAKEDPSASPSGSESGSTPDTKDGEGDGKDGKTDSKPADKDGEGDGKDGDGKKESTPLDTKGGIKKNPFKDRPTLKADKEAPLPDSIKGGKASDYMPAPVRMAEAAKHAEVARRDEEDGTVQVIECLPEDKPHPIIPFPKMYVHTLSPNVTRRVKGKGHSAYRSTDCGIKIRCNRLALNAASPNGGARLFKTRHLGGTVLIDASGSMCLTDSDLYNIAEKFPAGKVAYYSGREDGWEGPFKTAEKLEENWSGDLVIYAANGKIRKDHGSKLPRKWDGNLVDYAAIIWLLRQPAPRYMLFDKQYTGNDALITKARCLLNKSIAEKKITVFRYMETMMKAIKKLR